MIKFFESTYVPVKIFLNERTRQRDKNERKKRIKLQPHITTVAITTNTNM